MVRDKCPVCGTDVEDSGTSRAIDGVDVICPRCGEFSVTRTALVMLHSRLEISAIAGARVSHYIASHPRPPVGWLTVTSNNLDTMVQSPLPKPKTQRRNLLRHIAMLAGDDAQAFVEIDENAAAGIVGAKDADGVETLLTEAEADGLVEYLPDHSYRVTFAGWQIIEEEGLQSAIAPATSAPIEISVGGGSMAQFNRIIWGNGWPDASQGEVEYPADRVPDDVSSPTLANLPTLFMAEGRGGDQLARVGYMQVVAVGRDIVRLRYQYDNSVPPIPQDRLEEVATEIGLSSYGTGSRRFDWTHTRWTVQEGDLYRTMFRMRAQATNGPQVFSIAQPPSIVATQLSVMMPFDAGFAGTYAAIQNAAVATGMSCQRADDIWVHHNVIQDVVSLIDRSRVVVCDVTGRNPNVFYEMGIAHALGREVIIIAQHGSDVPFDVSHIRHLRYLSNAQGLAELATALTARISTILAR